MLVAHPYQKPLKMQDIPMPSQKLNMKPDISVSSSSVIEALQVCNACSSTVPKALRKKQYIPILSRKVFFSSNFKNQ